MNEPDESRSGAAKRLAVLLAILLGIPVLALVTSVGVNWKLNSELHESLTKQYPDRAAQIQDLTISRLCEESNVRDDRDMAEVCSLSDNMDLMRRGAVIGAGVSVVLLCLIKVAGILARRQRGILVRLFGVGIHLTLLILSALMILYTVLAMAAIYYGESALVGRIHFGIMIGLGLGALFGVYALLRAQFGLVRAATTSELAKRVEAEQSPQLWHFVRGLAESMQAQSPDTILAGLTPNFYVTEARVNCLDGQMSGRTLYVSLPLCRILTLEELRGVLAHELAHYKGRDTEFSEKFYPIYRGASQAMENIAAGFSEKGGASQLILLPAYSMIAFFLESFSTAEREISRERELVADREASQIVGARSFGSALVKICGFSPVWYEIRSAIKTALGKGKSFVNLSALFAEASAGVSPSDFRSGISEEGPIHPTDTHPRLSDRLSSLGLSLEQVIEPAVHVNPESSALSLFSDPNQLEESLTQAQQAWMVRTGETVLGTPAEE